MAWEGRTAFTQIGVGTIILIFKSQQMQGLPKAEVKAGETISIEVGHGGKWVKYDVVSRTPTTMEIKDPTGKAHDLELAPPGTSHINLQGMYSDDWVVRS